MESDAIYFRRRALEERLAALRARHLQARQRHLEMAERYDDLVRALSAREQQANPESVHEMPAA
jgi:hypothetical protein